MDWLESFSPMKVHWKEKWLAIPYQGSTVVLQGMVNGYNQDLLVQLSVASADAPSVVANGVPDIHPDISLILQEFSHVFAPVDGLPPMRACDHAIPLQPGAQPVFIRPYRYPPALKDEIEKQV